MCCVVSCGVVCSVVVCILDVWTVLCSIALVKTTGLVFAEMIYVFPF